MDKVREKLNLTKKRAREIVWGDDPFYETIEDEIIDTSRWSIQHHIIIRRKKDDKYFADTYSVGATEHQEESPYEYSEPDFTEVFPVEKTITVYE